MLVPQSVTARWQASVLVKYILNPGTQVFLNIVLDDAVEEKSGGEKVKIGMVVWAGISPCCSVSTGSDGFPLGHSREFGGHARGKRNCALKGLPFMMQTWD